MTWSATATITDVAAAEEADGKVQVFLEAHADDINSNTEGTITDLEVVFTVAADPGLRVGEKLTLSGHFAKVRTDLPTTPENVVGVDAPAVDETAPEPTSPVEEPTSPPVDPTPQADEEPPPGEVISQTTDANVGGTPDPTPAESVSTADAPPALDDPEAGTPDPSATSDDTSTDAGGSAEDSPTPEAPAF